MKKLLLFGLGALSTLAVSAQTTVASTDLQWSSNNQWPGRTFNETGTGLDLTAGTGKSYNLTAWVNGGVNDTIFALSPTDAAKADIKIKSSILGEIDYKNTGTDWAISGVNAGAQYNFVHADNYNATLGLPHTQGGTWNGATSAVFGFVNIAIAGEVLAEGTVTTSWGTFNCVLVKEVISGNITREAYYFETKEYGRVGVYVATQSKIWIMQSPIQVGTQAAKSTSSLKVFPNPATNQLTIQSDAVNAQVKIFNALGNQVKSFAFAGVQQQVNVSDLSAGVYVVQVSSATGIKTTSVVIK